MHPIRKIIHIDMDAFYASVEQLDNPELAGKPVIVGGRPDSRGVVAACSYEARRFGIRSAMVSSHALRLCPHAIFLAPRMNRYQELSEHIMSILNQYSDLIEPLSLDEAYLDITSNKKEQPSATLLAREIREHIFQETGLTASAGVSCNKFVAKIASDLNKPNGIAVIRPEHIYDFLGTLAVSKFHGVGKATEKKMIALGIKTGADLRRWPLPRLIEHFGTRGHFFFNIVRGNDPRPVQPHRLRKSLGTERTLKEDTRDMNHIQEIIERLADRVSGVLLTKNMTFQTVTLKLRYSDFTTITRSSSSGTPLAGRDDIMRFLPDLLTKTEVGARKIRLIGVTVSNLRETGKTEAYQLPLPFPPPAGNTCKTAQGCTQLAPLRQERDTLANEK